MEVSVLSKRLDSSERYFKLLGEAFQFGWNRLFDRYSAGALDLCESLVLVHPVWLEESGAVTPGRTLRGFPHRVPAYERCASEVLWGYACPFESPLESDHLFPWALGGPTTPANVLYLCRDHNRAKGHDIHLVPWEDPARFSWIGDEVASVGALRGRVG